MVNFRMIVNLLSHCSLFSSLQRPDRGRPGRPRAAGQRHQPHVQGPRHPRPARGRRVVQERSQGGLAPG